jgi:hypothetical protein
MKDGKILVVQSDGYILVENQENISDTELDYLENLKEIGDIKALIFISPAGNVQQYNCKIHGHLFGYRGCNKIKSEITFPQDYIPQPGDKVKVSMDGSSWELQYTYHFTNVYGEYVCSDDNYQVGQPRTFFAFKYVQKED